MPGIVELLAGLAGRPNLRLGLLTGNVRDGARLKLAHYGLHEHFAFGGFGDCVYPGGLLERSVKEFVIIAASRDNDCQFCTQSHCDLVKLIGMNGDPLNAIDELAHRTPRERLAIEYTRAAMEDSNNLPAALVQKLKTTFSDAEFVELTFLIGFINMLNLFNNCLQVRYEGEYSVLANEASKAQWHKCT